MKKEVGKRILLSLFLLVFLSSGIFAAAPTSGSCGISSKDECTGAGGYVLMGLSSSTNAHAENSTTGTYTYVLCCLLGTGNRVCDETNKIIGLSSSTNAHAETNNRTAYTTPICYEDFECKSSTSTCGTGDVVSYPLGVLSLTSSTNGHIGNISDYPVKICCKSSMLAGSCSFSSAVWGVENAISGQMVRLDVKGVGTECDGDSIAFDVFEYDFGGTDTVVGVDPISVAFDGDTATGIWYAEYQDDGLLGGDPEYYFNISRVKNPGISFVSSDPKLSVTETNLDELCSTVSTCGDYSSQTECESDAGLCNIAGSSSLPEVDCTADNIICGCSWSETEGCEFGWNEIESCGDPSTGCTYGCSLCTNVTSGTNYCGLGSSCISGDSPATNNNGTCDFGVDGCASTDCNDGDKDSCESGLYCLSDKCSSVEGPPVTLGSCKIVQEIEKDCEEGVGLKTIIWTGTWTGEASGTAYERCIAGGKTTVPCPAQIQLPFFDYYELIITIAVIALIYISLIFRRKFGKKFKRNKK